MEPIADFLDDLFIVCFMWRYWLLGAICAIPALVGAWRLFAGPLRQHISHLTTRHHELGDHHGSLFAK